MSIWERQFSRREIVKKTVETGAKISLFARILDAFRSKRVYAAAQRPTERAVEQVAPQAMQEVVSPEEIQLILEIENTQKLPNRTGKFLFDTLSKKSESAEAASTEEEPIVALVETETANGIDTHTLNYAERETGEFQVQVQRVNSATSETLKYYFTDENFPNTPVNVALIDFFNVKKQKVRVITIDSWAQKPGEKPHKSLIADEYYNITTESDGTKKYTLKSGYVARQFAAGFYPRAADIIFDAVLTEKRKELASSSSTSVNLDTVLMVISPTYWHEASGYDGEHNFFPAIPAVGEDGSVGSNNPDGSSTRRDIEEAAVAVIHEVIHTITSFNPFPTNIDKALFHSFGLGPSDFNESISEFAAIVRGEIAPDSKRTFERMYNSQWAFINRIFDLRSDNGNGVSGAYFLPLVHYYLSTYREVLGVKIDTQNLTYETVKKDVQQLWEKYIYAWLDVLDAIRKNKTANQTWEEVSQFLTDTYTTAFQLDALTLCLPIVFLQSGGNLEKALELAEQQPISNYEDATFGMLNDILTGRPNPATVHLAETFITAVKKVEASEEADSRFIINEIFNESSTADDYSSLRPVKVRLVKYENDNIAWNTHRVQYLRARKFPWHGDDYRGSGIPREFALTHNVRIQLGKDVTEHFEIFIKDMQTGEIHLLNAANPSMDVSVNRKEWLVSVRVLNYPTDQQSVELESIVYSFIEKTAEEVKAEQLTTYLPNVVYQPASERVEQ